MSITHAEKRAWVLRIRDVKESDKGWYMCQINTDPMKSQVGYLDVVGKFFKTSFFNYIFYVLTLFLYKLYF